MPSSDGESEERPGILEVCQSEFGGPALVACFPEAGLSISKLAGHASARRATKGKTFPQPTRSH